MSKQVILEQTGYIVTGRAVLNLWGSGQSDVIMDEEFIPLGQMTKENLMRAINDGRFGCQSIESAEVTVLDAFENGYTELNRMIYVEHPDPRLVCRGI